MLKASPIPVEVLKGEKLNFEEIQEIVIKNGFGVTPFVHNGIDCGMSNGINYALLAKSIQMSEVESALNRFLAGDWGTFYDIPGDIVYPGREYGEYPSSYGSKTTNGAIMVHREPHPLAPWDVVVYFQFER